MVTLIISDNAVAAANITAVMDKYGRPYHVTHSRDGIPDVEGYGLLLSVHCSRIIPKEILSKIRCVNIHPGLNPWNRGMFPHVWSMINGLPAGVTIHEMDEHIDNGRIIVQQEVKVYDNDTSDELYRRILDTEISLFDRYLDLILSGKRGNYNSKADYDKLCELDLNHFGTMRQHLTLLRALSHPPHWNAWYKSEKGKTYIRLESWTE